MSFLYVLNQTNCINCHCYVLNQIGWALLLFQCLVKELWLSYQSYDL